MSDMDFSLGESPEEIKKRNEELALKGDFDIKKPSKPKIFTMSNDITPLPEIPKTKPVDDNIWKELYLKQVEITNSLLKEMGCFNSNNI
jgi:hypothetical protein